MGCSILALPRVFAVCGMSLGSNFEFWGFGQCWQWSVFFLGGGVNLHSRLPSFSVGFLGLRKVLVELPTVYIRVFWISCMTKCCKHL